MDKSGMRQNLKHSGRQDYKTGLIITRRKLGLSAILCRQCRFLPCNGRWVDTILRLQPTTMRMVHYEWTSFPQRATSWRTSLGNVTSLSTWFHWGNVLYLLGSISRQLLFSIKSSL